MLSPLSPLSMTPAVGFNRSPSEMSVSPLETQMSHSRSPMPYRRTPRRAMTHPEPLPPLTFAKVPLSPAPSVPNSAIPSTDSEACLSDPEAHTDFLSRSPSLLTSLIQHQSRIANKTALTLKEAPESNFSTFPRGTARPILRRESTTTSSDCGDGQPAIAPMTTTATEIEDARQSIRHRRSCLKFAVAPRPLQLQPSGSRGPTSPLDSPVSSRRNSKPESESDGNKSDNEEDEDGDDQEVTTPGFGSDFGSDSDAGYEEDSEDGFTSEEEGLSLGGVSASRARRWRPHLAQWTAPPAPILSTPRRRAVQMADCPSTTDDGEPGRSRTRIRIHDEERHYTHSKPTRHRSPPPQLRGAMDAARPAPPAARSPSAAELCRRRSGVPRTPLARSPCPTFYAGATARGWKSDDGRSMRPAQSIAEEVAEHLDTLQLGSGAGHSHSRSVATVVAATTGCVKFQHAEGELRALREGRQHREERRRHGSSRSRSPKTGPPRPFRLARRDSAPAKIDEVHVMTSAGATACPRRGLKHVLRRAATGVY